MQIVSQLTLQKVATNFNLEQGYYNTKFKLLMSDLASKNGITFGGKQRMCFRVFLKYFLIVIFYNVLTIILVVIHQEEIPPFAALQTRQKSARLIAIPERPHRLDKTAFYMPQ